MLLVGQIYAPLDNSKNHRTLYQFCCINQQCYGKPESWVCMRDEKEDLPNKCSLPLIPITQPRDTQWNDDADDWSDSETSESRNDEQSYTLAAIEKLDIEEPNLNVGLCVAERKHDISQAYAELEIATFEDSISVEPVVKPAEDIRMLLNSAIPSIPESAATEFTSFYLNVIDEQPWMNQKLDLRAKQLLTEYQSKEHWDLQTLLTPTQKTVSKDQEDYEKTLPSHGDELVYKFITKLQSYPEQLIRYNRGATPLLLLPFLENIPHCKYCSSKLIFEMQLMPHLSQQLKLINSKHDGTLTEYGTIIIFTCSKSCWNKSDPPHEEFVVVQSELL